MRPALQIGLTMLTLLVLGCSVEKDEPPAAPATAQEAVSRAARQAFGAETLALKLDVADPGLGWTAEGLVEPMEGRFRVEGKIDGSRPSASKRATVVGTSGEGFEETFSETTGGLGATRPHPGGRRCWFNPHAPVGFYGQPLSVEEAMRLSGSVLESMRSELRSVKPLESEGYLVELESSAARPRDDFRETPDRVWGDRNLIANLQHPIEVRLSGATVSRIALTLTDYEGERILGPRPESARIRIEASLGNTDERLVIEPPECQALE